MYSEYLGSCSLCYDFEVVVLAGESGIFVDLTVCMKSYFRQISSKQKKQHSENVEMHTYTCLLHILQSLLQICKIYC